MVFKEKYPKISIVTPNKNGGAFLEATIKSVIDQAYPNLEYIVIDGASTDNSLEIIEKYSSNISYFKSEPDKSMYDAINKGFAQSSGEIMAYLNSDDLYHSGSLDTVVEIFKTFRTVNWLQGHPTCFDEKGRTCRVVQNATQWSKYRYYLGDYKFIQQESVFWTRDLWEKSGKQMDAKLKYAGDLELWTRFFRHEPLYVTYALIGGFRLRAKNQLSIEFMDEYLKEAEASILKMKKSMHLEEKKNLRALIAIKNKIKVEEKHKQVVKLQKEFNQLLRLPPMIFFKRSSQTFALEE